MLSRLDLLWLFGSWFVLLLSLGFHGRYLDAGCLANLGDSVPEVLLAVFKLLDVGPFKSVELL